MYIESGRDCDPKIASCELMLIIEKLMNPF